MHRSRESFSDQNRVTGNWVHDKSFDIMGTTGPLHGDHSRRGRRRGGKLGFGNHHQPHRLAALRVVAGVGNHDPRLAVGIDIGRDVLPMPSARYDVWMTGSVFPR